MSLNICSRVQTFGCRKQICDHVSINKTHFYLRHTVYVYIILGYSNRKDRLLICNGGKHWSDLPESRVGNLLRFVCIRQRRLGLIPPHTGYNVNEVIQRPTVLHLTSKTTHVLYQFSRVHQLFSPVSYVFEIHLWRVVVMVVMMMVLMVVMVLMSLGRRGQDPTGGLRAGKKFPFSPWCVSKVQSSILDPGAKPLAVSALCCRLRRGKMAPCSRVLAM